MLEPVGDEDVAGVVRRLGAVLASDEGLAELAVRTRRSRSQRGEVAQALAEGHVIKVFAFRGATHYLAAEDGGAYLALRAAGRQWELPSWQQHYRLEPQDWPRFRETVRDALSDGPLTLAELGAAVTRTYRHLREVFDDGATTLIKPLMWQGDMRFGPPRAGRATFLRLDDNPHWAGIWDLDDAGPYAVASYVGAYGPTTRAQVHYWLGEGLSAGRKRLDAWLTGLADRLQAVDVEGETAYVLAEHVDELLAARPVHAVRLLPGHDQWVLGASTKDEHVVPPAYRTPVTRKGNLVIVGGRVSGTWAAAGGELRVTWFPQQARPPQEALEQEVSRLATLLDRPLRATIEIR